MNHTPRRLFAGALILISALLFLNAPVLAKTPKEDVEVDVDYSRNKIQRGDNLKSFNQRAGTNRPLEAQVARKPLPNALRIEVDLGREEPAPRHVERLQPERSERDDGQRRPPNGRYHDDDDRYDDDRYDGRDRDWREIARLARRAASQTARELVENEGRREYYNAGFYDGLHEAMNDRRLGRWDFREGRDYGERSREAREIGRDVGMRAAEQTAEATAYENVTAQFRDLSREPRYEPYATVPAFDAPLRRARKPQLEHVFHDVSFSSVVGERYIQPLPDPWRFYCYSNSRDAYNSRWWDPDRAFRRWQKHNGSLFYRLTSDEKDYFADVFRHRYHRELHEFYERTADDAYGRGYHHGWDYGAEVTYEWNFRRGYHQGFNDAVRDSAHRAWEQGFERAYSDRYGRYFDEWSRSAKPEIHEASLRDQNGDGIFEPGEDILLHYSLVNYGGADGRYDAALAGGPLTSKSTAWVDLPRRRITRMETPIAATISAQARVNRHAETALSLNVGPLTHEVPLRVSYPLELDPRVRLMAHDSLSGRAVLEVAVRNSSRRPLSGYVEMRGYRAAPRPFDRLSPGGEQRLTFEVAGLHPLDMLGGDVELNFATAGRTVANGHQVHDSVSYKMPSLALDLSNRELLDYMATLAHHGAPSTEVRRAQELMLRRLRVDWDRVVEQRQNVYKQDLKNGTERTALGQLVNTYRRTSGQRNAVFSNLVPRIEALAKSTPGMHPFLKRSMKKLAREMA